MSAGVGWLGRHHADGPPPAPLAKLDLARDQGKQRVVAATAHTHAGVEVGAVLAHDDLSGVDELAAEALDAKALGVGVPAVPAGGRALLVCHLSPSPRSRWPSSWSRLPWRRRCS